MDMAILFQPSYLEGLEELLKEHDRLLAKKVKIGYKKYENQKILRGL